MSASIPFGPGRAAQVLLLLVISQLPLKTGHMVRLPREHNLLPLSINGSSHWHGRPMSRIPIQGKRPLSGEANQIWDGEIFLEKYNMPRHAQTEALLARGDLSASAKGQRERERSTSWTEIGHVLISGVDILWDHLWWWKCRWSLGYRSDFLGEEKETFFLLFKKIFYFFLIRG